VFAANFKSNSVVTVFLRVIIFSYILFSQIGDYTTYNVTYTIPSEGMPSE